MVSSANGATSTAVLINSMAPERLLNMSSIGKCSELFTREPTIRTKIDRPEPATKYIHGRPLLAKGSALNFLHPSDFQKGNPRSTESVMYRKKMMSANHRTVTVTTNFGSDSK